jgi:hypothetical protein
MKRARGASLCHPPLRIVDRGPAPAWAARILKTDWAGRWSQLKVHHHRRE